MNTGPLLWRHVTLNTKNSWLHGDERGFRDRRHRIHSSGDYKHRPPKAEHAGLRAYYQKRAGDPIEFQAHLRPIIARTIATWLRKQQFQVLAVACGDNHLHLLVQLPESLVRVKRIMGFSKRQACEAIRLHLTGEVWSAGGTFKLIKDEGHHRNTYEYIRDKQGPGTFVWTFRGEEHWMVKGKQKIAFEKDITPQF